jgi:hypothetical protein
VYIPFRDHQNALKTQNCLILSAAAEVLVVSFLMVLLLLKASGDHWKMSGRTSSGRKHPGNSYLDLKIRQIVCDENHLRRLSRLRVHRFVLAEVAESLRY